MGSRNNTDASAHGVWIGLPKLYSDPAEKARSAALLQFSSPCGVR